MVVPAELLQVLMSWQRWALGLEGPAFNQVALGVQRRVPGRGFVGKFGLGAAVVGQVTDALILGAGLSLAYRPVFRVHLGIFTMLRQR